jgi:hypothetical protein
VRHPDWTAQLESLLDHVWNGGFNRSSENHEGQSMYGYSKGIHPDLHPISNWIRATEKDETFALKVDWKPATTVGQLMDQMMTEAGNGAGSALRRRLQLKPTTNIVSRFLNFIQATRSAVPSNPRAVIRSTK